MSDDLTTAGVLTTESFRTLNGVELLAILRAVTPCQFSFELRSGDMTMAICDRLLPADEARRAVTFLRQVQMETEVGGWDEAEVLLTAAGFGLSTTGYDADRDQAWGESAPRWVTIILARRAGSTSAADPTENAPPAWGAFLSPEQIQRLIDLFQKAIGLSTTGGAV